MSIRPLSAGERRGLQLRDIGYKLLLILTIGLLIWIPFQAIQMWWVSLLLIILVLIIGYQGLVCYHRVYWMTAGHATLTFEYIEWYEMVHRSVTQVRWVGPVMFWITVGKKPRFY